MGNNERDVEWAKAMLERIVAIGETLDPVERLSWVNGPVAIMQELYAFESERRWGELFGHLVLNAVAMARPLPKPKEKPPFAPYQLAFGMDVAEAMRDLDPDRDHPGGINSLEAVQRLGDFVASVADDLYLAARHAVFIEREIPERFAYVFLKKVDEQWPVHVLITLQRCAQGWRDKLTQRVRGSSGGKSPRRLQSPAAILVAAVLREQPRLLDRLFTFRDLVSTLGTSEDWSDVSIDEMTITWEQGWNGDVMVYLGGRELGRASARALQDAFVRARRPRKQ